RGWAHKLMNDLTLCPHLTGEVRLFDIDRPMALLNARWGERVNAAPAAVSEWKFKAVKTLKEALTGADFVICSIQPGAIEMMGHDLNIPRKYGIVHPVGDTVGPAGMIRSLRSVGDYAVFAEAVERYCPAAWVINYTNPMTVCTRTLYKVFPGIKAFGCCHEVFSTQKWLGQLLEEYHGIKATRDEILVNVLGVNHFTWVDRARYLDIDLFPLVRRKMGEKGMVRKFRPEDLANQDQMKGRRQVVFDLFKRFSLIAAAGERHIVEFLPFYCKSEEVLNSWGVKLTPYEFRQRRYENAPREFRARLRDRKPFELEPSKEEGVRQMMALCGLGNLRTNVNLPNIGQIEGLPRDAVVETNSSFTYDNVAPEFAGQLPLPVETHVLRAVANQETIVHAGLTADRDLAFQAFLNDPLMTLQTDAAWRMFREMLQATKSALPKGWRI
ncbi:MAG: alpha-glucosidase/alpha-galactosidase, partial [Lentisphaerae bacterium]|nr:alpha-glucosidase/alpha-galactosidase [Lentisphaerota bacterium]